MPGRAPAYTAGYHANRRGAVRPYPPSVDTLRRLCTIVLACLLLAAGWSAPAPAATRDYYFTPVGSARGLNQNTVTAMVQDTQGFVWVGTQGGLHRYDGQRYASFRHDPRDPSTLPDSYITALALEGDSALWVGSYSQFVSRIDLADGGIRRFVSDADGQAGRQVLALLPRDGELWIGTMQGLERFDPTTGKRQRVLQLEPQQLRSSPYQQLLADRDGSVWWASAAGLFKVDRDNRARLVGPPGVTLSLLLDRAGQLWVGRRDGLFRLSDDGSLVAAWPGPATDDAGPVRAIVQAPDGALWLAIASGGLRRFDPASGAVRSIREDTSFDAGLPEDSIASLLVDRSGMLWVGGLFRGVSLTNPRGTRFSYVIDLSGERPRNAAADDSIRTIHEGAGGTLWIGTDNARLLGYDIAADRFTDWTARLPPTDDGRARRIMAIGDAGHGRLWLATSNGLLRFAPATGAVDQVALGALTGASLRSLLVDHEGDLWLGTQTRGALHYQRRGGRVIHYSHRDDDPHQLAHPTVHALLEDRHGRIWFGTGDGLDMLEPATGRLRHFNHDPNDLDSLPGGLVRALYEDRDGTLWVGTHSGLSMAVENADGTIIFQHPLAEALGDQPVPTVFTIASNAASSGRLWLGTGHGIIQFDTRTLAVRNYGLADGLQDLEFNGGAAATLSDGRIALGGIRGLNLFDPARMKNPGYTPPLRLLAAGIGADSPDDGGIMWQPAKLEVPDGAEILRLRIGALDFAPAANIRYRYRMDGFDRGWIDNGARPDITYTRLPPGSYVFRAQARNRDHGWGSTELRVPVVVAPPLWRHPLAIAAALAALLVLLATLGWRWHRHRQREQEWFRQVSEREERLKLALWASGDQFWDYDVATHAMHRMRVPESSTARPDTEITVESRLSSAHGIHEEDLPGVLDTLRRHLRGEATLFLSEHRTRDRDDEDWRWIRARGRVVDRDADGRALRVAGTARDITASRSAERERRISSEVLRSMAEAVAVFDRDFMFVSINPAFTRMIGYSDSEVAGRSTSLIDSSQHDPDFYARMRAELQRAGRWSGEIWQQRKDGGEFLCWLQASAVNDGHGQHGHYVAVLSDITDQKRAEQELRFLANYDTLTNLPNRALLSERLSRAIERARATGHKIAVLFLDLDRFKDINDSFGHAAGDRILRAAAQRLQRTVGAGHTVARLGGDEFTVVLEGLGDAAQAEHVARELLTAFEEPLDFDQRHNVVISPSIGISLYPDHARDPDHLLKHADTAMYQAKAIGRRAFMPYTESMDIDIRLRASISAALRKVLDSDELSLAFQPRLSLADGRITGVEALLRWNSAEHGEISPMRFIPLAEETGLILEIGEWALRRACLTLQHWRADGLSNLTMAVNVSSLQLLRGNLPGVVARVLQETGIPASCLELELTESVIMGNPGKTAATLQAFRELGVSLAIDDFGTGYSSLSYLKRLPITTLKIDKEFIADLTHDPDDAAITTTIITMAHSLGLNVVAEGVETEAQMRFLRVHGCDEIQGYWLARPMAPAQCQAFLQGHESTEPVTG
ncbi:EAL domain-containing protein [Lysobacter sp. F60174L2]|uniref:EAL domain-containing protein n=1 Tax=Lysobacter sp. F60174L2 TaxID=3459295 RepID=UPI00403E33F2